MEGAASFGRSLPGNSGLAGPDGAAHGTASARWNLATLSEALARRLVNAARCSIFDEEMFLWHGVGQEAVIAFLDGMGECFDSCCFLPEDHNEEREVAVHDELLLNPDMGM